MEHTFIPECHTPLNRTILLTSSFRNQMIGFLVRIAPTLTLTSKEKARISRQRDGGIGTTVALNRVLFESNEVNGEGNVKILKTDHRASHVVEVLKLPKNGGQVRAGIADQVLINDVPVTISDDLSVQFHLSEGVRKELPEPPRITLILAVPRPKVLARLLPQIAAVGVERIVLCNAYKVEKCYFDSSLLKNADEMRSLLIEGVAQSGTDGRVPKVSIERRLKVFLEDKLSEVAPPDAHLLLAEPGSSLSLFETLSKVADKPLIEHPHIALAIGPEGGWMPREVSMFEQMFAFKRISLGDRILRTDAAVLILLGLIHEYLRFTRH